METIIYHLHPLIAALSIFIFNYKFWKNYINYEYVISHRSRILSRCVDSLLLLTGVILWICRGFSNLLFDVKWFDFKLLLVVVYILLGNCCLKAQKGSQKSLFFYILAMLSIVLVIFLVKTKPF